MRTFLFQTVIWKAGMHKEGSVSSWEEENVIKKKHPLNWHYDIEDEATELPGTDTECWCSSNSCRGHLPVRSPRQARCVWGTLSKSGPEQPQLWRSHACPHPPTEPARPLTVPSSAAWYCHQNITHRPILHVPPEWPADTQIWLDHSSA